MRYGLGTTLLVFVTSTLARAHAVRLATCVHSKTPNVESMPWWTYVQRTASGDTNLAISEQVGISAPSVGRWSKGMLPDVSTAAAFARAYNRPVLEAFIAAGFLTPEEASERPSATPSLATLTEVDMLEEVLQRLKLKEKTDHDPAGEKSERGDSAASLTVLSARGRKPRTPQPQTRAARKRAPKPGGTP